jgi:hypothetical protein
MSEQVVLRRPLPTGDLVDFRDPFRIEAEFGGDPIGRRFDMIAGTSVGGLIAVALAHGVKALRIVEVLETHGPAIFPDFIGKRWRKLLSKDVYSATSLEAAIKDCLGAAATSPFADIKQFANCPDLHALSEAERMGAPIKMLSIGTAGITLASTPDQIPRRGLAWAKPALDLSIQAQEKHAQETCKKRLQQSYLHLNERPGVGQSVLRDLDRATDEVKVILKQLADKRFAELLKTDHEMSALKQIVSPHNLEP